MKKKKNDYESILRHEFSAEEGSFLIQLRCELNWDKIAFSRLIQAMEQCAKAHEGCEALERWIADGFWYVEWFAPEWSSHPSFHRPHGEDYYEAAAERHFNLSSWLFTGSKPYLGDDPLPPIT